MLAHHPYRLSSKVATALAFSVWCTFQAQAAVVIAPNAYTSAEAPTATVLPLSNSSTFQWVLPAADFTSLTPGTLLTSIGFRSEGGLDSNLLPVNIAEWDLLLSTPALSFPTLSTTFADNLGSDAVIVRTGPLNIVAGALVGGPGPNPFYDIPFDTPYAYAGGDLLVSLTQTTSSSGSAFLDGVSASATLPSLGNTVVAFSFGASSGEANFYNFPVTRFGTASSIPEPTTLALLCLGLAGLGVVRRRKS